MNGHGILGIFHPHWPHFFSTMSYQDDDNDYRQYDIRDAIIFLIELNDSMFMPQKQLNGNSHIFEILSSINELTQLLVLTAPNTGIGIYFYNTTKTHKLLPSNSHITRLLKLRELNVEDMQKLNFSVEDAILGFKSLEDTFPPTTGPVDLNEVFNIIFDEFRTPSTKQFNRRKLIWFTNNDNPYRLATPTSDANLLVKLRETTANYFNEKIPIFPMFLDKGDHSEFEMKFFEEIFLNTNFLASKSRFLSSDPQNDIMVNQEIKSSILRLKQVNRIQMACNIILSDGKIGGKFGCSVRGYALYNHEKARRTNHIYTKSEKYTVVELEGTLSYKDSGEPVSLPDDTNLSFSQRKQNAGIRLGFELGPKDAGPDNILYLNDTQMGFLHQYAFDHDPGSMKTEEVLDDDIDNEEEEEVPFVTLSHPAYLKLIGFRDITTFKPFYNISPPVFITYDPTNGSSMPLGYENLANTFRNLYQSCVKLRKYAILFGCTKKNSHPSLYTLYPTNIAKSSKSGNFPDGFLLIRLPWLDDIRALPPHMITNPDIQFNNDKSVASEELRDKFQTLVEALRIENYSPSNFSNPSLNYFYEFIKNDILQVEASLDSRKFDSSLGLLHDIFIKVKNNNLSQLIENIKNEMADNDMSDPVEEPPAKKAKAAEINDEVIVAGWRAGSLNQFTVAQLKAFSTKYKIKSGTKKQDFIDNVTKYLDSQKS